MFFIFLAFDETEDQVIKEFYQVVNGNKLVLTNSDRRNIFPDSFPLLNGHLAWFDSQPMKRDNYYWRFNFVEWMNNILDSK